MAIILTVRGTINMKSYSPCFNTKKVRLFVADLIIDSGYNEIGDLTFDDRCKFAGLLIEAAGRAGEHESLLESNDLDVIMYNIRKVLTEGHPYHDNLAFILKENSVNYYSEVMEAIFNERLDDLTQERHEWLNYAAKHGDPDQAYDLYRENIS